MKDPAGNVAPAGGFQNNGWYSGYNYYNGQFSANRGEFAPGNPNGSGTVSAEVNAQSAQAQGKTNQEFSNYLNQPVGNATPQAGGGGTSGGGAGVSGAAANVPDLQAEYEKLTNTPDIQALRDEIAKATQERDQAVSEAQNNPWYSQATRGGKIAGITSDAERTLTRLQGELNTKLQDAQNQLGLTEQQYEYQDRANQEALAANAVSTSTYDDGTNVYAVSIDRNGNVVNKQLIGGSKPTASSGKVTQAEQQSFYEDSLRQDAASGVPLSEIFSIYSGYLDPNLIYQLYNSNSKYGADKNSDATPGTGYLSQYGVTLFK